MIQEKNPCEDCPAAHHLVNLQKLGVDMDEWDYVVALAGNPNTGKSTVFNALTGLKQHTGNWPGKTVSRAEGGFISEGKRYKIVDLPGTYSLLSASTDEDIARNFILFGRPDVTVVVVDATRLERNLNLVLQILEITDRVVLCLNLMDEARRHGIQIDERALARDLGVPVIPTAARQREGLDNLLKVIGDMAQGRIRTNPHRIKSGSKKLQKALNDVVKNVERLYPELNNSRWVALRLLEGDPVIINAIKNGEVQELAQMSVGGTNAGINKIADPQKIKELTEKATAYRLEFGEEMHDALMEAVYEDAGAIVRKAVTYPSQEKRLQWDQWLDKLLTSKWTGFPMMLVMLTVVFWLTISGANVPSALLADFFMDFLHPLLKSWAGQLGTPWWLSGFLIDGVYLSAAWVISVMLPPMAVFFPLFTILEDFGYLPRVAFNLDGLFRKSGAHGKQALTMAMGYGCNAAGVIATRIIDSPRERLIAIITNNFALCNGRWPTQILLASLFIGALAPPAMAGLISASAVVAIVLLGVALTFITSWFLSRTILKGEPSAFSLELPPYRPPRILQTLYTSLIDRTIYVLWRAIIFAAPAGAVIWLFANISIGNLTLAEHIIAWLDPIGLLIGLNGVILLAYIIAIPANEIIIPTVLMLTVLSSGLSGVGDGAGVLFELESADAYRQVLQAGGWSLLTALNVMLFSLVHNPCSTTIYTIYKETGSKKWTMVATLLPLFMGFALTFFVTQIWRIIAG
ncbi:MAG TPA: ferrous iron transport protein B [Calditrichaeota bacterium]|nr:ferrous iron transport protein B [Calditrichota bacterium]